jgi:transposase
MSCELDLVIWPPRATFPDALRARIRLCRVARRLLFDDERQRRSTDMAIIGMDIHRAFAEAVAVEGKTRRRLGRVELRRDRLEAFATGLKKDDIIVVEATGNAAAVAEVLAPHVGRVVIANPKQVHIIARAKIKTDKIDAAVLAQLYASGFLPEVWIPDDVTQALRRQVTRRNQIVRQRTRLKNIIQSILHAHLIPACPAANMFGRKGRTWLSAQHIPEDERLAIERHMREIDRLGEDLKVIQRDLAQHALGDLRVARLMTIPGLDMVVTIAVLAAIGDIRRFASPQQLVSYLGLNPSVRQSGSARAYHGRITRPRPYPGAARGSGLGRSTGVRSAAGILSAHPIAPWPARRSGSDRQKARGPDLAPADQGCA